MKYKGLLLLTALFIVCPLVAVAQSEQEFVDTKGKFKISLLGDWRSVSYSDAVGRQKTEFIYRDRSEGLLKIGKENLNGSLADLVRQEEENMRVYRSGFERSASGIRAGSLRGMRLSSTTRKGPQIANTYIPSDGTRLGIRFTGRAARSTPTEFLPSIVRSFRTLKSVPIGDAAASIIGIDCRQPPLDALGCSVITSPC